MFMPKQVVTIIKEGRRETGLKERPRKAKTRNVAAFNPRKKGGRRKRTKPPSRNLRKKERYSPTKMDPCLRALPKLGTKGC